MPRELVNSPTVGPGHKPRSDPQQYSPPAQQVVTQGASDKQVSSLECFPLQAVHLDVASDCKIPGDSTGRGKVGLLFPGECQCRLWVTVCPGVPRKAVLVHVGVVSSAPGFRQ